MIAMTFVGGAIMGIDRAVSIRLVSCMKLDD